jgi:hypothetical protein
MECITTKMNASCLENGALLARLRTFTAVFMATILLGLAVLVRYKEIYSVVINYLSLLVNMCVYR